VSNTATHQPAAAATSSADGLAPAQRRRWKASVDRFAALYVWAVVILIFSLWVPGTFLTRSTLDSIASSQSIAAILAMGLLVPLACGVFDLSIGYTLGITSIFCSWLMVKEDMNALLAVALTMLLSLAIGALNGVIVVRLRLSSFIATLGTGSILGALTVWICGGEQIVGNLSPAFTKMSSASLFGLVAPFYYLLALCLIVWYVLERTAPGRFLFAVGGNLEAARLAGIRTQRYMFVSLVTSAVVAGFGGLLYLSTIGSSSTTAGPPYLFPAYAAAFLGATQIKPGRFNVWGTFVAIFLLATGVKGLQLTPQLASTEQWIGDFFYGAALILAVALSISASHRISRKPAGRSKRIRSTTRARS